MIKCQFSCNCEKMLINRVIWNNSLVKDSEDLKLEYFEIAAFHLLNWFFKHCVDILIYGLIIDQTMPCITAKRVIPFVMYDKKSDNSYSVLP